MTKEEKLNRFNKIVERDEKAGLDDFQLYFTADEIKWLIQRSNVLNKIEYELDYSDLNTAIERILSIQDEYNKVCKFK